MLFPLEKPNFGVRFDSKEDKFVRQLAYHINHEYGIPGEEWLRKARVAGKKRMQELEPLVRQLRILSDESNKARTLDDVEAIKMKAKPIYEKIRKMGSINVSVPGTAMTIDRMAKHAEGGQEKEDKQVWHAYNIFRYTNAATRDAHGIASDLSRRGETSFDNNVGRLERDLAFVKTLL